MNKEFIPYQQALTLKHLEFNEPCFGYYNEQGKYIGEEGKMNSDCNKLGMHGAYCTAPTFSQAFRWFRENCDWPIETWVQPHLSTNPRAYEGLYWRRGETESVDIFKSYEEAQIACLIKLIEIAKTL